MDMFLKDPNKDFAEVPVFFPKFKNQNNVMKMSALIALLLASKESLQNSLNKQKGIWVRPYHISIVLISLYNFPSRNQVQ